MIDEARLTLFILEYEQHVKRGNEILQTHFDVSGSPYRARCRGQIPKQGEIESADLSFNFHGIGCTFEFGKIVVDFDYSYEDGDFVYKGFNSYRICQFIKSSSDLDPDRIRREVHRSLLRLEQKGILLYQDWSSACGYEYMLDRSQIQVPS